MIASRPVRRFAVCVLVIVGLADMSHLAPLAPSAYAQDKPDNLLMRLFQPPASGSVPTPGGGGTGDWSGQAGASGDPRMTAEAIRAAAADFDNCLANLWPDAARRGVSQENYQRFTAGLTPDLHIMDLLDAQPEFTKST